MKRFILLISTIVSVAIAVHAVNYDLWINGIQVTSSNASNLGSIGGTAGTITYNASTKTLTLNNATIYDDAASNIKSAIDGLTINVVGNNMLQVTGGYPSLHVQKPLTITGTGTLDCSCTYPSYHDRKIGCLIDNNALLSIEGGVQAKFSGAYGIMCIYEWQENGTWFHSNNDTRLIVSGTNTKVTAYGSQICINNVPAILNDGLIVSQPSGAFFSDTGDVVDASGNWIRGQDVVIKKRGSSDPEYYNLWINGVQVTSANASDLSVINGVNGVSITGSVYYNATTNTLTLDNAYLYKRFDGVVRNSIEGLKIKLIGDNTMGCYSGSSLFVSKSLTITGTGTLKCISGYYNKGGGAYIQSNATLTIQDGARVQFSGMLGIFTDSPTARMVVKGSTTKVTAKGKRCCIYQTPTTLYNGLALTLPTGAHFDSNGTVVDANNDTITSYVHISSPGTQYVEHDLWINDTQVTSANASDLSVIDGVTGNVSFDEYTNTLTLNNAMIAVYNDAIKNEIEGLTMNVVGTNTVVSHSSDALVVDKSMTISGPGVLNCSSSYNDNKYACSLGAFLTLVIQDGVKVKFTGCSGIKGPVATDGSLTSRMIVNGAATRVTANGSYKCISGLLTTLNDGLAITQPVGAYFDSNYNVVDFNGNIISDQDVVISYPVQEPYAVYDANSTTLTFAYGNKPVGAYDLPTGSVSPGWYTDGIYQNVTKVVFDESFANARPTHAYYWFNNMTSLTTITGMEYFNTSEIIDMTGMFNGCTALTSLDLSHFDTGNLISMASMFRNCTGLTTLDLSSFNTAKVEFMNYVFRGSSNLTTIIVADKWSTESITESVNMFYGCTKLKGGMNTAYDASHVDAAYAHIDLGTGNPGYLTASRTQPIAYAVRYGSNLLQFYYDTNMTNRDGTLYLLNTGTTLPGWYNDVSYANVRTVTFSSSFADARPTTTYSWFRNMTNLTTVNGMEYLNTSEVTEMSLMFSDCGLTSIDLSHFDTSNATEMFNMFLNGKFTILDFSNFDTGKVKRMNQMVKGCSQLTKIYVSSKWSTASLIASYDMFTGCTALVGGAGTTYDENHVDAAYAHIDGGTANPGYFTAKPARGFKVNGIWYDVVDGRTNVIAPQEGDDYTGEIVIPDKVSHDGANYSVEAIEAEAFTGTSVTRIDLPASIVVIGSRAFKNATNLERIIIRYQYLLTYVNYAADMLGGNAMGFTCYVRNRYIDRYESTFPGVHFSPWVLISESYYTELHPYRAFSCKYKVTLPEGLEAYYVKDFNSATRTAVTQKFTGVLPANTGFLLKGSENKIYLLKRSTIPPATITDNLLLAYVPGDQPWTIQDDNARFYFDDFNNEWISTTNLFNYSSYLQVPKSQLGDDLTSPIHLDLEYTPELLVGDANEDGAVNVNDITTIINYILGKNPNPFNFDNANVNGDNKVDVLDITALINIILGIN